MPPGAGSPNFRSGPSDFAPRRIRPGSPWSRTGGNGYEPRPAGKPRLRSPGLGQLRGLGVKPGRGTLPTPPPQWLLHTKVPQLPGVSAPLGQSTFCAALGYTRNLMTPNVTLANDTLPEPDPPCVVAASYLICTSTWCSAPGIAVACSTRAGGASTQEPTCGPCGGERQLTTRTHHQPCPSVTTTTTPRSAQSIAAITPNSRQRPGRCSSPAARVGSVALTWRCQCCMPRWVRCGA